MIRVLIFLLLCAFLVISFFIIGCGVEQEVEEGVEEEVGEEIEQEPGQQDEQQAVEEEIDVKTP